MGAFFNGYSGALGAFGINLRLYLSEISGRDLISNKPVLQEEYLLSVISFHDFDVGS
ncbi:hypothetical protein SAMN04488522_104191 [Pedobacter caeni]|uniref:Uncharacterized protein n=1 Tax=Pedobacter caeni TaxID=288992 RepID=A0A1M5GFQ4_9SPHI|nr:hypothetical protein SAMN04488522_104191 [Pedobacter caeni]